MNTVILSLGDMPAGKGFGGVVSSALLVIGVFALIYAVLMLLDKYHAKHSGDEKTDEPPEEPPEPKTFPQVLSEQIRKNDENDRQGRA